MTTEIKIGRRPYAEPSATEKGRPTSVYLSIETIALLNETVARTGKSRSWLIEQAVGREFGQQSAQASQ